jgi:hypothetical protein
MGQGALAIWGLHALSHCVGCSNHIQSANDSNFPWMKDGGQVNPSNRGRWAMQPLDKDRLVRCSLLSRLLIPLPTTECARIAQ